MDVTKLRQDIIDISYKKKIGHVGSNLAAIDSIAAIYEMKQKTDYFVLSSGHAALSLYVVLKEDGFPVDPMDEGTHPNRDIEKGVFASSGSLGHGIGIAVGMALSDRGQFTYCVSSDGETQEGSFWEAINVAAEQKLSNFKLVINANGYGAYKSIDTQVLINKLIGFQMAVINVDQDKDQITTALSNHIPDTPLVVVVNADSSFADTYGIDAHYLPITDEQMENL